MGYIREVVILSFFDILAHVYIPEERVKKVRFASRDGIFSVSFFFTLSSGPLTSSLLHYLWKT